MVKNWRPLISKWVWLALSLLLSLCSCQKSVQATRITVTPVGRWFTAPSGSLSTINQGSELRLKVTGSAALTASLSLDGVTQPPTLAVSVDGGPYQVRQAQRHWWSQTTHLTLAEKLDPQTWHAVSIVADGIHEHDPIWEKGAGLQLRALQVARGGEIKPWPAPTRGMMWVGTSIFAGILARGSEGGSLPHNSAGSAAYPFLVSRAMNQQAVIDGFGAVGVTAGGSGGVPAIGQTLQWAAAGQPLAPFADIDTVIVGEGVNDRAASSPQYQAALGQLVATLKRQYPHAHIYLERSLNGAHAADTQAIARATGSTYVDTSSWKVATTDGVHPSLAGHQQAAKQWLRILKP